MKKLSIEIDLTFLTNLQSKNPINGEQNSEIFVCLKIKFVFNFIFLVQQHLKLIHKVLPVKILELDYF